MNPEECECNVDVASRLPGYSHALDLDNLTETKNITCLSLCLTQFFLESDSDSDSTVGLTILESEAESLFIRAKGGLCQFLSLCHVFVFVFHSI